MTLTRWKLLAGLLGLSMGGVAAIADPPCTARTAGPPVAVPCPVVSVPVVPVAAVVEVVQVATPVPQPTTDVKPPEPLKLDLPKPVTITAEAPPTPTLPVPGSIVQVGQPPEVTPPPLDTPMLTGPATTPPPAVKPARVEPRLDPPAAPSKPAPLPDQTAAKAGNVRVVIQLGGGQPRFEVMSGDDTVLKVVSDKVDVRSPSEKGEIMTALKAGGAVRFTAPGCEGVCNELTVLPGSGDVELSGDVRVKCKQGKGSTEIVAAKLTFKLGSAPAYSVSDPDSGAVTASFTTQMRR